MAQHHKLFGMHYACSECGHVCTTQAQYDLHQRHHLLDDGIIHCSLCNRLYIETDYAAHVCSKQHRDAVAHAREQRQLSMSSTADACVDLDSTTSEVEALELDPEEQFRSAEDCMDAPNMQIDLSGIVDWDLSEDQDTDDDDDLESLCLTQVDAASPWFPYSSAPAGGYYKLLHC